MLKLAAIPYMGKLCSLVVFMVFVFGVNDTSFAQSSLENPNKVSDYLGDSRFNELLQSNPSYLEFLDVRCSYGYKIIDMPAEKTVGMTVLNSVAYEDWQTPEKSEETVFHKESLTVTAADFVASSNSEEFNFLKYHFQFDRSEMTYYVLGNTGKVIQIYPIEFINKKIASSN